MPWSLNESVKKALSAHELHKFDGILTPQLGSAGFMSSTFPRFQRPGSAKSEKNTGHEVAGPFGPRIIMVFPGRVILLPCHLSVDRAPGASPLKNGCVGCVKKEVERPKEGGEQGQIVELWCLGRWVPQISCFRFTSSRSLISIRICPKSPLLLHFLDEETRLSPATVGRPTRTSSPRPTAARAAPDDG